MKVTLNHGATEAVIACTERSKETLELFKFEIKAQGLVYTTNEIETSSNETVIIFNIKLPTIGLSRETLKDLLVST